MKIYMKYTWNINENIHENIQANYRPTFGKSVTFGSAPDRPTRVNSRKLLRAYGTVCNKFSWSCVYTDRAARRKNLTALASGHSTDTDKGTSPKAGRAHNARKSGKGSSFFLNNSSMNVVITSWHIPGSPASDSATVSSSSSTDVVPVASSFSVSDEDADADADDGDSEDEEDEDATL